MTPWWRTRPRPRRMRRWPRPAWRRTAWSTTPTCSSTPPTWPGRRVGHARAASERARPARVLCARGRRGAHDRTRSAQLGSAPACLRDARRTSCAAAGRGRRALARRRRRARRQRARAHARGRRRWRRSTRGGWRACRTTWRPPRTATPRASGRTCRCPRRAWSRPALPSPTLSQDHPGAGLLDAAPTAGRGAAPGRPPRRPRTPAAPVLPPSLLACSSRGCLQRWETGAHGPPCRCPVAASYHA